VVYSLKGFINEEDFRAWGWRLPFVLSLVLLAISVYVRGKLEESPTFQRMKATGRTSRSPIRESFLRWSNLRLVLMLFCVAAALGAIFGTGHFYSMFFLNRTLKLPLETVHLILACVLLCATPLYLFFGWLSDRWGRKPILVAACLLAALTTYPIFKGLTHYANPALETFLETPISVAADGCEFRLFSAPAVT
jgi:MFS family permease